MCWINAEGRFLLSLSFRKAEVVGCLVGCLVGHFLFVGLLFLMLPIHSKLYRNIFYTSFSFCLLKSIVTSQGNLSNIENAQYFQSGNKD